MIKILAVAAVSLFLGGVLFSGAAEASTPSGRTFSRACGGRRSPSSVTGQLRIHLRRQVLTWTTANLLTVRGSAGRQTGY